MNSHISQGKPVTFGDVVITPTERTLVVREHDRRGRCSCIFLYKKPVELTIDASFGTLTINLKELGI